MTQELKTCLDNAKLVADRDSKRHKETCLQIPPDDSLNQSIADTESKQTGKDSLKTDSDFAAKRSRTLQWVSEHCDSPHDESKQTKTGTACLAMDSKILPEHKLTSNSLSDDANNDPNESEITDEVDMALVEMKAEGMAGKNRSMYFVKVSHIISAQIEQAQLTHDTLTHDIQHLKAEGRKLLQLMRMTRTHLMIENELKMMYGG